MPALPHIVLLDLGGVLVDVRFERSLRYWHECAQRTHHASPSHRAHSDLAAAMPTDAATRLAYERHERGEIDFATFCESLAAALRLSLTQAQWLGGWNAALGDALPDAVQVVQQIADRYPVYLFSNTNAAHHAHWRQQYRELLEPMRAVFVSNELRLRKPDPSAFKAVAQRIGVDEGDIMFFDDRMDNVRGAQRAGLRAFEAHAPTQVAGLVSRIVAADAAK